MKYIRTKDKIYIAGKINGKIIARGDVAYNCDSADIHFPIIIKEKDIIKQADTIEELCDEFVVYVKDNKLLTNLGNFESCYNWYNELKNRKGLSKVDVSMFGAIWTELGLKYVAKINEKGELELL